MSKFKVGDKVKLVNPMELGRNFWGRTGVVKYTEKSDQDDLDYAVEFGEESPKFHNCFGHCAKNCGYWCNDEMIELVEQEPEYYNGKIFVVDGDKDFKTGHIYSFKNGYVISSSFAEYPTPFYRGKIKDFAGAKDYFLKDFSKREIVVMEVKED